MGKLKKSPPRIKTPAEFLVFFAGDWQERLEAVNIPGMPDASWDRKAAWLLWKIEHDQEA